MNALCWGDAPASTRTADNLAYVVYCDRSSDIVAVERAKLLDLARFRPPNDSLGIEDLRGNAGWVMSAVLRHADYLAEIVDRKSLAVIASQRGERGHNAILPAEGKTYMVDTLAKVAPTEITLRLLPEWICLGCLGCTDDNAKVIGRTRSAVEPSECAEVDLRTLPPQEGVLVLIALQVGIASHPAVVVNPVGCAYGTPQRPEVDDGVANLLLLRGEPNRNCQDCKYRNCCDAFQ